MRASQVQRQPRVHRALRDRVVISVTRRAPRRQPRRAIFGLSRAELVELALNLATLGAVSAVLYLALVWGVAMGFGS